MSFSTLLQSVSLDVLRHSSQYTARHSAHDALAPYATPQDVLAALAWHSGTDPRLANEIVVALLQEHRSSKARVWSAILVAAYTPMLLHLRARLGRKGDEDVDQQVLLAFVNAMSAVRLGPYATVALRWSTQKEVFQASRRLADEPETILYGDDAPIAASLRDDPSDRARLSEVIAFLTSLGDEVASVVLAEADGASLTELAADSAATAGRDAHQRECRRLAKERTAALAKLREAFADAA